MGKHFKKIIKKINKLLTKMDCNCVTRSDLFIATAVTVGSLFALKIFDDKPIAKTHIAPVPPAAPAAPAPAINRIIVTPYSNEQRVDPLMQLATGEEQRNAGRGSWVQVGFVKSEDGAKKPLFRQATIRHDRFLYRTLDDGLPVELLENKPHTSIRGRGRPELFDGDNVDVEGVPSTVTLYEKFRF
jgi:hypothetical protein